MRMRRWRIWARVLALAVLALAARPATAMADEGGDDDDGHDANRLVHIGPQMTLIEGDDGKLRVWEDDPALQAPECESPVGCWFNWVEAVAGVTVLGTRNITNGAELPGTPFQNR